MRNRRSVSIPSVLRHSPHTLSRGKRCCSISVTLHPRRARTIAATQPAGPATMKSLLQAEPVWFTAQRQGVRTLVYDWPLSQSQTGELRNDYFLPDFENDLKDEQRLEHLLNSWRNDAGAKPLQLLMGYIKGTD